MVTLLAVCFHLIRGAPNCAAFCSRAIGRIAGQGGKTRHAIENATRTRIVVADQKIHILGSFSNIMAESKQRDIPAEMVVSEKWDACLERTLINFGIGIVAGGLTSVVLTRAPGMRRAVLGFGGGCGVGSSWVQCSQEFAKK